MSAILPIKRLRETSALIAFHHPQPAYQIHILLVPKREIGSLSDISVQDQDFLIDVVTCVQSLVSELKLVEIGYRLVVNGGVYQDFPILHFHLISGPALQSP